MVGFWLYALGALLVRILPRRLARAVAVRLADMRFALDSRNRKAVESNVRQVLGPGAADVQVHRLARRIFRNFACLVLEFLSLPQLSRRDLSRDVRIRGWRHFEAARARGRGVVLLGAHVGSWELGGAVLAKLGVPVAAVARDHGHPRVTRFFNRRREAQGIRVVGFKGSAASEVLRVLRRNGVVALLGDRDLADSGADVRFFGRPARLPRSPVTLARRTGAAILPAVAVRRERGGLHLIFERPIFVGDAARMGADTSARRCAAALERHIRRHLDQWFAFERVWEDGNKASAGT